MLTPMTRPKGERAALSFMTAAIAGVIGAAAYVAFGVSGPSPAPVQPPTVQVQQAAATATSTAAPVPTVKAVAKKVTKVPTTTKKVANVQPADVPTDSATVQAAPNPGTGNAKNGAWGPGQPGWSDSPTSSPSAG